MATFKKLTAAQFNAISAVRPIKTPVVKVINGKAKITEPLFTIEAGIYKWFVLVPAELLSDFNWVRIFRRANKNTQYTSYDLANGSVLFAFK